MTIEPVPSDPAMAPAAAASIGYIDPRASGDAVNDSSWRRWPRKLRAAATRTARSLRGLGPYVAIELLLPGGSIIALALWVYRRRLAARATASARADAAPASTRTTLRCVAPCSAH